VRGGGENSSSSEKDGDKNPSESPIPAVIMLNFFKNEQFEGCILNNPRSQSYLNYSSRLLLF